MESNPLHDKTNYQGAKLVRLVLAMALPASFYYFRIALTFAAERAGTQTVTSLWLLRGSTAALVLFFAAQLGAAWYLRRLLRTPKSPLARTLQIAGIAVLCGAFSVGAAVMLESFAYEMLIRTRGY